MTEMANDIRRKETHMQPAKTRILVVEDDPAIASGLCDVLVFNGYHAETVADGNKGCESALAGAWDLILLDVMLPGMDGFSICREIRRHRPTQPVILLTAKGSEEDIVTGFTAGADDYVSKPFSLRELMVRVEAVLRRSGKAMGDERIRCGNILFDGRNLQAACEDRTAALTRREMDILVYLFRHRERIVSKVELLTEVWHYKDPGIETRTVDIHILKLSKKIASLTDGSGLIETVRGEGYRLESAS
jgi:DNA-binding response OmpR family regulator